MLKKDRVAHYLEKAERLEYIIPNFDPANGDMILVFKTEDASGGRSFRLSPRAGRGIPFLYFPGDPREGELIKSLTLRHGPLPHGGGPLFRLRFAILDPLREHSRNIRVGRHNHHVTCRPLSGNVPSEFPRLQILADPPVTWSIVEDRRQHLKKSVDRNVKRAFESVAVGENQKSMRRWTRPIPTRNRRNGLFRS